MFLVIMKIYSNSKGDTIVHTIIQYVKLKKTYDIKYWQKYE